LVLGFDFSFLATLGLIVTASRLQKALDFIPPAIAAAIAVPVAATLWTMPVQMLVFKEISLYGILANLVTEPYVKAGKTRTRAWVKTQLDTSANTMGSPPCTAMT
jgi:ComEC/Rec2-related protein